MRVNGDDRTDDSDHEKIKRKLEIALPCEVPHTNWEDICEKSGRQRSFDKFIHEFQ